MTVPNPQPFDGHDVPEHLRPGLGVASPDLAGWRRLCSALAAGDQAGVDQVLAEVAVSGRGMLMLLSGATDYIAMARERHGDELVIPWLNTRAMRQMDVVDGDAPH
jgi:hypothetical protein